MSFEIKKTKNKAEHKYRTLYISEELETKILQIAKNNDTSFNNVVISMIEHCLKENKENNHRS